MGSAYCKMLAVQSMKTIQISEIPDSVYHYTNVVAGLQGILHGTRFVLGSIGKANDPKETKHKPFAFSYDGPDFSIERTLEVGRLDVEINRILNEEYFFISLSVDDDDLSPPEKGKPDFSYYKYGYSRPRLWAHYGGVMPETLKKCLLLTNMIIMEIPSKVLSSADLDTFGKVELR